MRRTGYIALGSNLGVRAANLQRAVDSLVAVKAVTIEAASHVLETPPWGYESASSYLNAVLRFSTTRADAEFDSIIADCESALGRDRSQPEAAMADRPIDIDLIWLQHWEGQGSLLEVPHPRAHLRAFVLLPLEELEAEFPLNGMSIAECVDALPKAELDSAVWQRALHLRLPG